MGALWAGIDAGKRAHHCVVIDDAGSLVLSQRVENDERRLLDLLATVLGLGGCQLFCVRVFGPDTRGRSTREHDG